MIAVRKEFCNDWHLSVCRNWPRGEFEPATFCSHRFGLVRVRVKGVSGEAVIHGEIVLDSVLISCRLPTALPEPSVFIGIVAGAETN